MDVLRAALGERQLTYLGKSYGTFLGAWYAQLFPSRVRALVLDGAVDPGHLGLADDLTQAEGFETAFRSFAAWCLAATGCPLAPGTSVSAAVTKTGALITGANTQPLANHLGDDQVADGAMLVNGIAAALYSKETWNDLKIALTSAFGGDGTELLELANYLLERNSNGTYSNLADADTVISCLDRPYPARAGPVRGGGEDRRQGRAAVRRGHRLGQPDLRLLAGPGLPRCPASGPPGPSPSWSSARCATRPRRTGRPRRWPPTWPRACCWAGMATVTPPTARAAPAWTRS